MSGLVPDEEAAGHHVQPGQTDAASHPPEGKYPLSVYQRSYILYSE